MPRFRGFYAWRRGSRRGAGADVCSGPILRYLAGFGGDTGIGSTTSAICRKFVSGFRQDGISCFVYRVKTYLLVGAHSGIGEATRRRVADTGHRVIVASRSPRDGDELAFAADAAAAPEWALPETLDGCVYFPGTIRLKPFHRLTCEEFEEDYRINVLGAVRVLQCALPALKRSGDASVVLFSTVAVTQGMPSHASIAAAKGAVEGLARSLAAELAPRVRVNVVAPSLTDTPLAAPLLGDERRREAAARRHPLQQIGRAEDVADLVAWLLSPASRFMTGQVLRPDGGLSSLRLLA